MKRVFPIIVTALTTVVALGLAACNNGGPDEGVAMTLSTEHIDFDVEGSSEDATVTVYGADWSAHTNDEWLSVEPASGAGGGMFTVTVTGEPQSDRQGTVTVTNASNIAVQKFITVKQEGPEQVTGPDPDAMIFINGWSKYYGDYWYGNGVSNFDLTLFTNDIDQWSNPVGNGYEIYIDFFSEAPARIASPDIAAGTYTFDGLEEPFSATSMSYVSTIVDGLEDEILDITGGTFTVERNGDEYILSFDMTLSDASQFKAYYRAPLRVVNPLIVSELRNDLAIEPMNSGNLQYWGDYNFNGTYRYMVDLWTPGMDYDLEYGESGIGDFLVIEFNAPQGADNTILSAGTYTVVDGWDFEQWTIVPGSAGGMGGSSGSWYRQVVEAAPGSSYVDITAPLVSGEVEVSYDNGIYRMALEFRDDAGNLITGTFNGTLEYKAWR